MNIRLAKDDDGQRIGELARASGFAIEGIDWSSVYPHWLVAEHKGELVGAIQVILSKPVGWLEILSVDPDLPHRKKALAVKELTNYGMLSLKAFGSQLVMGVIPNELESYQRVVLKRGFVDNGAGNTFVKRL